MRKYLKGINIELLHSLLCWNLAAIAFGLTVIIFIYFSKRNGLQFRPPLSAPIFLLVLCYAISVASVTIIPIPYTEHFKTSNLNLVPIVNTYKNLVEPEKRQNLLLATDVAGNILGNIVLFLPLGIIIPALFKEINNYPKIAGVAAAGSILIELTQLLSRFLGNYRQVDIDDVILNTVGALAGFFIYRNIIERKITPEPEKWY